jgi:putative SOS response-associated peptidase YedK
MNGSPACEVHVVCGRFNLFAAPREVADLFALCDVPDLPARYNIAPSQMVATVELQSDRPGRVLTMMRWGLVPHWSKGDKPAAFINARAESAAVKPAFRDSFRKRRCLIPASGFFEWAKTGSAKQPYHFHQPGGSLFAFAGLWDRWTGPAGPIQSCCILTTEANEVVRPLHDRMPVIMPPADFDKWLDSKADPAGLEQLLRPLPANELQADAVSTLVNSPKNEGPELLKALA